MVRMPVSLLVLMSLALPAVSLADGRSAAPEAVYPELKVEGGFDNAQLHGIRIEDAAGVSPRVILAGNVEVEEFRPEKGRDPHRYIHWHFRLRNLHGRTVRFERYTAGGALWPSMTQVPTVRYEDGGVELIRPVTVVSHGPWPRGRWAEKLVSTFSHRFRRDVAYVSLCLPFTNDDVASLAEELKDNPFVMVKSLGRTPLFDLPLYQFIVTDPAAPDAEKRGVWLLGGEDPWEFPGVYALAGFLRFAASDDPLAAEFRRKVVLSGIPFVNPDAVYRGDTNFYLGDSNRNIINSGLSWRRTDIPSHEMVKAAMHQWNEDGRAIDLMTRMHSSCFWSAVMRLDWAYDEAEGRRFAEDIFSAKYIPWAAGQRMATPADRSGALDESLASKLWPERLLSYGQHLEQIVMPRWSLLGEPRIQVPDDLPTDYLRCQKQDLFTQGELFARAVAEFYGLAVAPEQVPPFLMCGDVDAYWGPADEPRTYSVLYRDTEGRQPQFVRLHVAGKTVEMKRAGGETPVRGYLYEAAVPPAEGDNSFHVTASNGVQTIRYPAEGSLLGPYVADQP